MPNKDPKVLDELVKACNRQTKVLQDITKLYQFDLIKDTALADDYPDEIDQDIQHYESLKKADSKSKGVH